MKAKDIFTLEILVRDGKQTYVGDGIARFWVESDMLDTEIELRGGQKGDALTLAYDEWCLVAVDTLRPDPEEL